MPSWTGAHREELILAAKEKKVLWGEAWSSHGLCKFVISRRALPMCWGSAGFREKR